MKTDHQKRVEAFMKKDDQELPDKPCIPSEEVTLLRATLIMEEALETVRGLGIRIKQDGAIIDHVQYLEFDAYWKPNLEQIADGCADLSVVTIGTLSACGIHDDDLLREVDRSNNDKFRGDVHKNSDGKWIKPSDWQPPKILEALELQKDWNEEQREHRKEFGHTADYPHQINGQVLYFSKLLSIAEERAVHNLGPDATQEEADKVVWPLVPLEKDQ